MASAGNFGQNPTTGQVGYSGATSPGNAPSAITVGCAVTQGTLTRGDDRVAAYSSRGPTWYDAYVKPNLVAPGHSLASDAPVGSTLYNLLTGQAPFAKSDVGEVLNQVQKGDFPPPRHVHRKPLITPPPPRIRAGGPLITPPPPRQTVGVQDED